MWLCLWWLGCGSSAPNEADDPAAEQGAGHRGDVDVAAFAKAHSVGVQVLDVRTPDEFGQGHVPGALLAPIQALDPDALPDGLDKAEPLYVVCASGGRSSRAADQLAAAGWHAINVQGGTRGWIAAGHAVDKP